jgi:hypothetical protein
MTNSLPVMTLSCNAVGKPTKVVFITRCDGLLTSAATVTVVSGSIQCWRSDWLIRGAAQFPAPHPCNDAPSSAPAYQSGRVQSAISRKRRWRR